MMENLTAISNPSTQSPLSIRLWRPAAQRNLRNQWSKLLSKKVQWMSMASEGRSNATALVNAHLTQRYIPQMDFGVLKEMPGIIEKSAQKFAQKQEIWRIKLLSSYKDMVKITCCLSELSTSMRCFQKGSCSTSIARFCNNSDDRNDMGDGGGVSVFSSWPMSHFEELAQELVDMFVLELSFKRLLVVSLLLSTNCQEPSRQQAVGLCWSSELYPGEFDDLTATNLISKESGQPISPGLQDPIFNTVITKTSVSLVSRDVLQVYLTAWFSNLNIDMNRVEDIFGMVEWEMQVKLS